MSKRNLVLTTDEIYHVFNRSVGKQTIFSFKSNLTRILDILEFYRFPQELRFSKFKTLSQILRNEYLLSLRNKSALVEIYAYAFMPNHFHLLLKQLKDKGIARFVSNIQNSFAKYFNTKFERHGALFQNPFKAKRVETDEQFVHVSRYIHLNPVTSYLIEFDELSTYPWTSFPIYAGNQENPFVSTKLLLQMFGSKDKYIKFVGDQVDYQRKLAVIKDLIIE